MHKDYTIATYVLIILLAEKVVQHVASVPAFLWDIGDIRASFAVDYTFLIGANIVLAAVYSAALYGVVTRHVWGLLIAIPSALFDIIAEYVFHGLFTPLTVSVIVATVIVILALAEYHYRARERRESGTLTSSALELKYGLSRY